MTIDDKIRDEKLQCDINREAVTLSALSSGKTEAQRQVIEQARSEYYSLGKAQEKQAKTIEDQVRKQINAL